MAYPVSRELSRMSGSFGPRKPIRLSNGQWSPDFHGGVDFTPTVKGATLPVYAVGNGTVYGINLGGGAAGNNVMLRLSDGSLWWYGHLSRVDVRRGQVVTDGQQIGLMGRTGNTTGVHLHLERHYPKIDAETDPWPHIVNQPDPSGKANTPTEGDALMAVTDDDWKALVGKVDALSQAFANITPTIEATRSEQVEEDGVAQVTQAHAAAARAAAEETRAKVTELHEGLVAPGERGYSWLDRIRSVMNTLEKRGPTA